MARSKVSYTMLVLNPTLSSLGFTPCAAKISEETSSHEGGTEIVG